VLTTANAAGTNGLTCLPKHGGAQDNKVLVTHPMTDQRCLTSAVSRRIALTARPSSSSSSAGWWVLTTANDDDDDDDDNDDDDDEQQQMQPGLRRSSR
jgi:hypothetical protein